MALNKTQSVIALKLGLADEDKVISKAAEFERLLQTKTVAGSNISDNSKTVICLDLAAEVMGTSLDLKTAIKYSGLKAPSYTNCRKVIQNLLELSNDKLTTHILCNTLQCASVQPLADRILEEYQKQAKMELDLNLPHNICMAVYQACRLSKVKVPKSKFVEKSRLKPAQWTKLDIDWTKFAEENFAAAKKKRGRPAKVVDGDKIGKEENMEIDNLSKVEDAADKIEPYEDWKKRILEAAYKELMILKEVEQKEMLSPRRSPRKTPQKYSPYKSPTKKAGVRLLFPLL